eukprot:TRINITY_DN30028_c0_g1_i2.p3 TRINITY_DN30028_c0_g1~~TRINITY_DN30028_c0_g1_i2.p3  ORF type:complete len:105 (+),score=7.09 TRINITY_DN30028_c0_g1_i2:160-474(+)
MCIRDRNVGVQFLGGGAPPFVFERDSFPHGLSTLKYALSCLFAKRSKFRLVFFSTNAGCYITTDCACGLVTVSVSSTAGSTCPALLARVKTTTLTVFAIVLAFS